MQELSKKIKKITDITRLEVDIDYISHRSDEWWTGKYDDQDNMDYILMQFNLINNLGYDPTDSDCSDILLDGDKLKFIEINKGFNLFNIRDSRIEDMYKSCVENGELDYFVFYSASRSTVVVRKLNMGDRVQFKYRGMISAKTALENLKDSRSPTSYKFISVNSDEVIK
jgi:hypothetical protein